MSKVKLLFFMTAAAACSAVATQALQHQQQQPQQQTRREPQFENEHVKVWKSIILPNQPLRLHRHDHGRALVALKGGTLKVVDESGKAIDTYVWEDGKAYWLDADPPDEMHGDLNEGPGTIEVIVVELQK